MNIALTKHFEELIARLVASGRYNNSSEVVRACLRILEAEEKAVARLGEPFRTSWTPASASAFLRSRGFRVNHDVGVSELRARYLEGTDGKLDGEPIVWYRILDASVR